MEREREGERGKDRGEREGMRVGERQRRERGEREGVTKIRRIKVGGAKASASPSCSSKHLDVTLI